MHFFSVFFLFSYSFSWSFFLFLVISVVCFLYSRILLFLSIESVIFSSVNTISQKLLAGTDVAWKLFKCSIWHSNLHLFVIPNHTLLQITKYRSSLWLIYRVFIKYCDIFQDFSKVCHLSLASTRLLLVVQKITSQWLYTCIALKVFNNDVGEGVLWIVKKHNFFWTPCTW